MKDYYNFVTIILVAFKSSNIIDICLKSIDSRIKIILVDNSKEILKPEIRIYSHPETLTYEASNKTKFFSDIYLTMSNITRSEYYNIKFQNKPFMFWIWFSAILVSFGGFMRLLKKRTL